MARFWFIAPNSSEVLEFLEKNWFTGKFAPGELSFFFTGDTYFVKKEDEISGEVDLVFNQAKLDKFFYFGSVVTLFAWFIIQGDFVFHLAFRVLFGLGLFFSFLRTPLPWAFLFRKGLEKKGVNVGIIYKKNKRGGAE